MNSKYPDIESFRKFFYKKYPDSKIIFLEFISDKRVKVRDGYDICIIFKQSLLESGKTSIRAAINKTEYFINQAKEIHGNKYDYSLVNYINSNTKIKIICPIHGEFEQKPTIHLDNSSCPKCGSISIGNKLRKLESTYIEQMNKIWNGKYSIKEDTYLGDNIKIPHFCNIQKYWFNIKPSHILAGHGCRKCSNILLSKRGSENPIGWSYSNWEKAGLKSKRFEGFKIYIIKCWNDEEEFYKIGKTFNNIKRRFEYKKLMPYKWEIIKLYNGEAREISELEIKLKNMNKEYKYLPNIGFEGKHECFSKLKEYEKFFSTE